MSDVVLVCMPFGPVFHPSLGLSLIKAELARQKIQSRTRYFSMRFAQTVGHDFYYNIAEGVRPLNRELAGEWIFSGALHPATPEEEERYLDEVLRGAGAWMVRPRPWPVTEALIAKIRKSRERVNGFLDDCLADLVAERPRVVGFTSLFQQHLASLALARRLKEVLPETVILLGGANCEGVMGAETIRRFPFIDAAVAGEADLVVCEIVTRALNGQSLDDLPGVRTPGNVAATFAAATFPSAPMVRDMDELPFPDFSEFFEQHDQHPRLERWETTLFFESSRGCWWGEKQHCTFCGLNGANLAFRSKSPRRFVDEVVELAKAHPNTRVWMTDNIIDWRYFREGLPELRARGFGSRLDLFYEVKSNLSREQVLLLRDAGIPVIQPGIESLSDSVLQLMRKGVSALQNVQLLKWCRELGVGVLWHFLWGFPNEDPAEYDRQARMVPFLTHLPPPQRWTGLRIDRFSPNFFDAERLGVHDLEATAPYRHVYQGLPAEAIANLAYSFNFRYADRDVATVQRYTAGLVRELKAWQAASEWSALLAVPDADGSTLLLWDLRPAARQVLTALTGLDRAFYLACDEVHDLRYLLETVARNEPSAPHDLDAAAIEARLAPLVACGLMLRYGSRYLSLAVALAEGKTSPGAWQRLHTAVRALGTGDRQEIRIRLDTTDSPGGRRHPDGVLNQKALRALVKPPSGRPSTPFQATQFRIGRQGLLTIGLGAASRS